MILSYVSILLLGMGVDAGGGQFQFFNILSLLVNSRGMQVKKTCTWQVWQVWLILNLEQNHELLVKLKTLQRSINWIRATLIFRQKRGSFAFPTISNWNESVSCLVHGRPWPIREAPISKKCSFFEHCSKGLCPPPPPFIWTFVLFCRGVFWTHFWAFDIMYLFYPQISPSMPQM